jgi:ABC-2 type transport system permease protein
VAASHAFRGLTAFTYTELFVQLHEITAILTSLVVQVILLIFVAILDPKLIGLALMGAILFSLFTLGQRVQNEAAYIRIDHKLDQLYLTSPLAPESYFFGMSVAVLLAYLPPIGVLVAVTAYVTGFSLLTALILLAGGAALWLFSCSIGYIVSTFFRDMRAIWSYASIFYNVFGVLPPVFYPIGELPGFLRPLALAVPPSAAAGLAQWSVHPGVLSGGEVLLASVALGVEALLTFYIAILWSRRSVREP